MYTRITILLIFFSFGFADEWNTVYLASFPRSGNHWVRFLTEEATHIATSSVYRDSDYPHLPDIFPWNGYSTDHGYKGNCRYPTGNDPVFIKTHYPRHPKTISPTPEKTVCLIRHPIDSFYSYHLYRQKKQDVPLPKIRSRDLTNHIKTWREFYEYWENQPNVLMVRYEDLFENLEYELSRILTHAGYSFDQADITRASKAYPPTGEPLKHLCQFSEKQIKIIKERLRDLLEKYGYDL